MARSVCGTLPRTTASARPVPCINVRTVREQGENTRRVVAVEIASTSSLSAFVIEPRASVDRRSPSNPPHLTMEWGIKKRARKRAGLPCHAPHVGAAAKQDFGKVRVASGRAPPKTAASARPSLGR